MYYCLVSTFKELRILSTSIILTTILGCNPTVENSSSFEVVENQLPCSFSPIIPKFFVLKDSVILKNEESRWYYKGKLFSGYAIAHHENGSLSEKMGFTDGKRNGKALWWYRDGQLKKELDYLNNKMHGKKRFWGSGINNSLLHEFNYQNGKRHGIQQVWYANGEPFKKGNYAFGFEQGIQQAWNRNGKLYINYEAKNGRTFGLRKATLCYKLEDQEIVR